MRKILIGLIRFYQKFISPVKGRSCRFYPTCSEYTIDAIREYGPVVGLFRGLRRLLRCHPLHPGGYDPLKTNQRQSS
jgi:putative membrane protein insertion efficiency factor